MSTAPRLQIDFNGLCSFAQEEDDNNTITQVHVLLVAANRLTNIKPPLHPHKRYLVLNAGNLRRLPEGLRGPEYTCFSGRNREGKVEGFCLWDIDGYHINIRPMTEEDGDLPSDIASDVQTVLNLDDFGGGGVKREFVENPFENAGPIGARVKLKHGILTDAPIAESTRALEQWKMCLDGDREKCRPLSTSSNAPVSPAVRLKYNVPFDFVRIEALAGGRANPRHDLNLDLHGAPVCLSISNLCAPTAEESGSAKYERDVLAYYDLIENALPQGERWIPKLEHRAFPGRTYCPDAFQSLAPRRS